MTLCRWSAGRPRPANTIADAWQAGRARHPQDLTHFTFGDSESAAF